MDYRYLKAFIATAKHLSFSTAASELNIAQSAVSRQIKLLEESIGEELIIRSSKKVLLTQKGKELYLVAKKFEQSTVDIFQSEDTHVLRIGILQGLLEDWLTPVLAKYAKKTNREIQVEVDDETGLLTKMERGKFDMIFSTREVQSELLSSLKLFDEKLLLISKNEISKADIHHYRWILYSHEDHIFDLGKKTQKKPIVVPNISSIVSLVKGGVGIAVVPDHSLSKKDKIFTLALPKLKRSEVFMTCLNFQSLPQPIQEFTEVIKKELEQN